MFMVTTITFDQLSALIKNNSVSLDNNILLFGEDNDMLNQYFNERFGTEGYVLGIRGRINHTSAELLYKLDNDLKVNKVILETPVDDNDVITFDVDKIQEAIDIIAYGLPKDILYEHLDEAALESSKTNGIKIICVPSISRNKRIRISSLNRDISFDDGDITVVKL